MRSELAILFPEHLVVVTEGGLVLFVVFNAWNSIVLVEIWYTVHLMALAGPHELNQFFRVCSRSRHLLVVERRPDDVEIRTSVVHVWRSSGELRLLVESVNLSGLGVSSIGFLLDLISLISKTSGVVSISEGNFRSAFVVELSTVKVSIWRIDVSTNTEGALLVQLIKNFDTSISLLAIVMIKSVHHLWVGWSRGEIIISVVEAFFLEHHRVISLQILSLLENILFPADASSHVFGVIVSSWPLRIMDIHGLKLVQVILDIWDLSVGKWSLCSGHWHVSVILIRLSFHFFKQSSLTEGSFLGYFWGVWLAKSASHNSSTHQMSLSHFCKSWGQRWHLSSWYSKPCGDSYSTFYEAICDSSSRWLKLTINWDWDVLSTVNWWFLILSLG